MSVKILVASSRSGFAHQTRVTTRTFVKVQRMRDLAEISRRVSRREPQLPVDVQRFVAATLCIRLRPIR
jgi:hypothetical protein